MLKKVLKFLRSMAFGMVLLVLILICSLAGSLIAQGNDPSWYVQTYLRRQRLRLSRCR